MKYSEWKVEAKLKFPSCYHSGWETMILARTKTEAIKQAKREAQTECIFSRQDGAIKWTAEKIDEA